MMKNIIILLFTLSSLSSFTQEMKLLKTLSGHTGYVNSALFSPDGKYIVTSSNDKTAKVWETATGKLLNTFSGHKGLIRYASFSPDGNYVVTASEDRTAMIWKVSTGKLLNTLSGHTDFVYSASYSPDGKYVVTASEDKTAKIWETATSKLFKTLSGHTASLNSALFSPDGKYTVTSSNDKTAKVWETVTGKLFNTLSGHADWITYSSFSPDGKYLVTASYDMTAKIWETATGKLFNTLSGHRSTLYSASFSSDGKYVVTASSDRTAKIWETATSKLFNTLSGHGSTLYSASFSPDGKYVVTASSDMTAKIWFGDNISGFIVSSVSKPNASSVPKPNAPADLEVSNIIFNDSKGNGNNILDADERAEISFTLSNNGKGVAYNLLLEIDELNNIKSIQFDKTQRLGNLAAGKSKTIKITLSSGRSLQSGKAKFKVKIKEGNYFDADPFEISFVTQEFKKPIIAIADYSFTNNEGEGKITLGKIVTLKMIIQNQGQGDASNIIVDIKNPDNVYPGSETQFVFSKLKPNESKEVNYEFFANKRYSGSEIPIQVNVVESHGKYGITKTLAVSLTQTLAKTHKIDVDGEPDTQIAIQQFMLGAEVDRNIPVTTKIKTNCYALIIGNEDYTKYQSGITSESNVEFAINDARIFKEYCIKTIGIPEENITYMINATSGQMHQGLDKLNKLAKNSDGKAELIFYYAGHGLPEENSHESYLMPVDVSGYNIEGAMKLSKVYGTLTEYAASRVTVFLDACFSGGGRNQGLIAARGVRIRPKADLLRGNIVVFSASSGEQISSPYREKQHGLFTYYLLKRLQDTKGNISYKELADYLQSEVGLNAVKVNSKEQNPQVNISPDINSIWESWKVNY
jgi:WD40 repeat protein